MKQYLSLALGTLAVVLLAAAAQDSKSQSTAAGGALKVTVNYTGTGTVDDTHKIYIALWDSPDFVQPGNSSQPLELKPVSSKNGSATFTDVKASPVYLSTVYDPKGAWEAQSAPPSGSSLGLYSKEPGKPAPIDIKPGSTATAELSFDDKVKMP